MTTVHKRAPALYIPHGGGPLPLLGDPGHDTMVHFLRGITPTLENPSAVLVVSAHWEEPVATITAAERPQLIYDYSGFPKESYEIPYPAPGDPALARTIRASLVHNGIEARLDEKRGFDHGMFVPLKIMYPAADMPSVQLSLVKGLDPAVHLRLGRALSDLRDKNVLILGSGFSFHNMREFFSSSGGRDTRNAAFQEWLLETCATTGITAEERTSRLTGWTDAPSARYCHPREEHLIPLHVCCGTSRSPADVVFDGEVLGKRALGLLWHD